MPYFVFRILPGKQPELVASFDKYKDAKDTCRSLRMKESPDNPNTIRMAHAESEKLAKRLLTDKRQPSSPLEEWEA
jgi:hypothetical protein